jgi:hypothetical protein
MGSVFFVFVIFIVIFTLVAYFSTRWASGYVERHIKGRLDAIDSIANDRQVPESWLAPYRQRAARLMDAGASESQLETLSSVARKRCVANIQELVRFVEARGLSDSESTKVFMLTALREESARWGDEAVWAQMVNLTAPAPEIPDDEDAPAA